MLRSHLTKIMLDIEAWSMIEIVMSPDLRARDGLISYRRYG